MGNKWEIQNELGSYSKFLLVDINKFHSSFYYYKFFSAWFNRSLMSLAFSAAGLDKVKNVFFFDVFFMPFETDKFLL